MHPNIEQAFDEIDAAIFGGDTFFCPENLATLKAMLARWQAALPRLEEMAADTGDADE